MKKTINKPWKQTSSCSDRDACPWQEDPQLKSGVREKEEEKRSLGDPIYSKKWSGVTKENELSVWNRTPSGCIWESGKVLRERELASFVVWYSMREGRRGGQSGKVVFRSFLIFDYKPILTFSKSLQKIQIDFQFLMMRWDGSRFIQIY